MNFLLYWVGRCLIAMIQALPLTWVARLGRVLGGLAHALDGQHRGVVLANLTLCFGQEKSAEEIAAIARENFKRIGENYLCAIKTVAMTMEQLKPHMDFVGAEKLGLKESGPSGRLAAIGHFGNFELYARFSHFTPPFECATTYRALKHPAADRLMMELRRRSDCLYFERRKDGVALKAAIREKKLILGFLADQSSNGVRIPFMGHDCNTTTAPAVFGLRYQFPLFPAICYRTSLAHWRMELDDEIPTHEAGRPRSTEAIMRDVNAAYERAVRLDPANWFWVHRRWKD